MNFQEKLFEATADLRSRAALLANTAVETARERADLAAKRMQGLKGSFAVLSVVGREFNKVALRHAARFVKQNSAIAAEAGKEVSALARSAYITLAKSTKPAAAKTKAKTRKSTARRRVAKAA